jgi:uncharacterized membrane protein YhaH (DUF805 family)
VATAGASWADKRGEFSSKVADNAAVIVVSFLIFMCLVFGLLSFAEVTVQRRLHDIC